MERAMGIEPMSEAWEGACDALEAGKIPKT
jgi:hypothetical protein